MKTASSYSRRTLGVIRASIAAATAATVLTVLPSTALAQASAAGPVNPARVVSINPFVLLFGYFSGEFEQRVRPTLAIALAGSSADFGIDEDHERRTNVDLKARLYPSEKALQGLGLAAGIGYTRMKRRDYYYAECNPFGNCDSPIECRVDLPCVQRDTTRTFSAPSFSIEFTYQWLLGRQKATAFTIGFGAKRAFTSAEKWGGYERITPTGKLNVGYAF